VKSNATLSKPVSSSRSRRHRYTKVRDNRKHPIRGLWRRNGNFYARITTGEINEKGEKVIAWVPLVNASTASEAQDEFRTLLVERDENRLRPIGLSPLFKDYAQTYVERQETIGKKHDTVVTERTHINRWIKAIGPLRLDKIRPHHITDHLHGLRRAKKSARTCNLSLTCLRNVLKSARIDGHLKTSPADGLEWFKTEKKAHRLYSPDEIDRLCQAALAPRYFVGRLAKGGENGSPLKNGIQFCDYLRFLQYSGGREQESLRVRLTDVDMNNGHVMIGAEGDAKNREARAVDLNAQLRQLLEDMATRRAPDSQWLFPSPQRGESDEHAKTFRESLKLAREAAGLPDFGFHDLRRFFASRAVMSGIDFLTVSRWLGHKDGGILLGKSYAHLANEHTQRQAARLTFRVATGAGAKTEC
jgi:integrase